MPATSVAQRELMAIAEHHPEQVSAKNRGVLKMSHQQLHDFAATKQRGLPQHSAVAKMRARSISKSRRSGSFASRSAQARRAAIGRKG